MKYIYHMKKVILSIFLLSGLLSCGTIDTEGTQRPTDKEKEDKPDYPQDTVKVEKSALYITGIDYPDGYNWRADSEAGSIRCSLVVFADGKKTMEIPVGKEYMVSPDPDRHRVIKGALYTDYCTSDETIIKRDGVETVRYAGCEFIREMTVCGDDIYTLGIPKRGKGFSYRKNGEIVLRSDKGYLFPGLDIEDGSIYFSYSEPAGSGSGTMDSYYHVCDGDAEQVVLIDNVTKVLDMVRHNGEVFYIALTADTSAPVIAGAGYRRALEVPDEVTFISADLLSTDEDLYVEAVCRFDDPVKGSYYASTLWKEDELYHKFSPGFSVSAICASDDGICCIINSNSSSGGGTIFRCGERFNLPIGYTSMGKNPMAMTDGVLYIGLTSLKGGKPILWKDGEMEELDLNGMICTLVYD